MNQTEIINSTGSSLSAEYFLGNFIVRDEKGTEIFQTREKAVAEFLLILSRPGIFQLRIPVDKDVIINILDSYRSYLQTLREQLLLNANQKTHSYSEAERLAKEVMEDYGFIDIVLNG
ncbi:MAG: hypothetical protein FJY10_02070 [Bacteroidetes bacterium]|nr:hypothetical protein [Bacteroidota bacterium]